MIRISKLADYSTVIMTYLARGEAQQAHNAKDIATQTHLSLPTVSKILKQLARAGLLVSQRGAKGGYTLALSAQEISVAQIIYAVDGGIALTECSHRQGLCSVESLCAIRNNWRNISQVVYDALENVSLAEMIKPLTLSAIHKSNLPRAKKSRDRNHAVNQ